MGDGMIISIKVLDFINDDDIEKLRENFSYWAWWRDDGGDEIICFEGITKEDLKRLGLDYLAKYVNEDGELWVRT